MRRRLVQVPRFLFGSLGSQAWLELDLKSKLRDAWDRVVQLDRRRGGTPDCYPCTYALKTVGSTLVPSIIMLHK